MMWKKNRPR